MRWLSVGAPDARRVAMVARAFLLLAIAGCLPGDPCIPDTRRCDGAVLEECTRHEGGVYGTPPMYVGGSDASFIPQGTCRGGLCVETASGDAVCALERTASVACTTDGPVCDGTTLVTCRGGYALERERCRSCDAAHDRCDGGLFASCKIADDCADGMICGATGRCEQPCACPEDASCEVCDAAYDQSNDPDLGTPVRVTCRAGSCVTTETGT